MKPPFPPGLLAVFEDPDPLPATWNMAYDEALMERARIPMLRFYRWRQPAVSFGCFQPWQEVAGRFPGRNLVRRPTGGGAVEHGDGGETATYALAVPRVGGALAALGERPGEAFRRVHSLLAEALSKQGLRVTLHEGGDAPGLGGACFQDRPVPGDLVRAETGQKVAGAAQRRTRAGMLHQGSIRIPGGLDVTRLVEDFDTALTGGRTVQGRLSSWLEVWKIADELVRTKYGQRAWTERR